MPLPCPLSPAALEALAAAHGTPFQLYDEGAMRANARAFFGAWRARFPTMRQFFAVKALPNPAVLRALVDEGCGLDCSSAAELALAASLGVTGEDVMFTSNYTSPADLALAASLGVVVNLDDASLVPALAAAAGGRAPPLVSFRLNPGLGRTDSETASNVLGGPTAKFGVPPADLPAAYAAAAAAGATRFGLHMMTGSCVTEPGYWQETVAVLLDAVAAVHAATGVTFEFLNIGGGLGIPYRPGAPPVDVGAVADVVAATLGARWAATRVPGPPPALFMEHGRFFTGPYGWLVARCHAVKRTPEWGVYYGLDACMAHLMRPGMYGAYHHITVPAREAGGFRHAAAPALADGDDEARRTQKAHVVGCVARTAVSRWCT